MHAKSLQSCLILYNSMDCTSQASLCMEFSKQEYWCGLLFPPPGNLPDPGIKRWTLMFPGLAGEFFTTGVT